MENGRIVAVGPVAELRATYAAPVSDFPGCAILPGMVNAHTHLELTHFPSWKVRKDLDFLPKSYVEWIVQVVKIRRALTPEELQLSVREGIRMSLESGTTAIGEILTDFSLAPLYRGSGLQGRLFLEAIGHDPVQCDLLLERIDKELRESDGSLLPGISPHTPHTVSRRLFLGVEEISRKYPVKKVVHLSESQDEVSFMQDSKGPIAETIYPMARWDAFLPSPMKTTSTAFLDQLGFLDPATLVVHAVHVTPADAAILKRRGVTVILCPRSNDTLSVGTAPHHLFKSLEIPLAVGTDSLASNDSLSIWDELRFLMEVAPDEFGASELLRMATLGGANALGIEREVGSLVPGKRADFQVAAVHEIRPGSTVCATLLDHGRIEEVYLAGEPLP